MTGILGVTEFFFIIVMNTSLAFVTTIFRTTTSILIPAILMDYVLTFLDHKLSFFNGLLTIIAVQIHNTKFGFGEWNDIFLCEGYVSDFGDQ